MISEPLEPVGVVWLQLAGRIWRMIAAPLPIRPSVYWPEALVKAIGSPLTNLPLLPTSS